MTRLPGAWVRIASALLLGGLLFLAQPTRAVNLVVSTSADSGPGSLRQAITDNNGLGGTNFIVFSNIVTVTLLLTNPAGELVITKDVFIIGPGAKVLAVSGNNSHRVFYITNAYVEISGLAIINGNASGSSGGGIRNELGTVRLTDCTLSGNSAGFGGGIFNNGASGGAIMYVRNCTLNGNSAATDGGAILNYGQSGFAGLTVQFSTLDRNSASYGGGIYNDGRNTGYASSYITASTLHSNSASIGGGIVNATGPGTAELKISASTLSGNSATTGGGIYNEAGNGGATLEIGDTILKAGASGANIQNAAGTVMSRGYNLSSDAGGGFLTGLGDQVGTDPLLGPLQDNGGPTPTIKPRPGSPAIDQGKRNAIPGMPSNTDQRGRSRPFTNAVPPATLGDQSDIGAFEVQADDLPSAIPPWLVSWWRAENNRLDSAGANHAASDTTISYDEGKVGRAFKLTGSEFVRVPASESLNVGTGSGFSIETWIKPADTNTSYPIVEWNEAGRIGVELWANKLTTGLGPGCVFVSLDNSLAHTFTTSAVLQTNTWHQVVLTYDKFSGAVIYVNGTLRAQANFLSVTPATAYDLYIGRRISSGYFLGSIDEVSLFSRALSAADVGVLYTRGALGKELPRLCLMSSPPSSVSLFWQLAFSHYQLESRSNLTSAPWLPVSQVRTQAGAEWQVVAPKQPTHEFFRLKKP